jgi:hypothetical protein
MLPLVSESKPSQDDVVRAGFRFLLSLVAQENTQVAACGTIARSEIRSREAHVSYPMYSTMLRGIMRWL